jgi:hypothetical protein
MKKKNDEQLKQEIADIRAKARSESEERQKKIKQFWDIKKQDLKAKTYNERKLEEQKLKDQKLETILYCIRELVREDALIEIVDELRKKAFLKSLPSWPELCLKVADLVHFADLQDREIEHLIALQRELERIRHYYPEELEHLSSLSLAAELKPYIEKQLAGQNRKQAWERHRRRSHSDAGSIEYQYGGAGEAEWRKSSLSGQPYQPTCLHEVLIGTPINMRKLQELFWPLSRDRLSEALRAEKYGPIRSGREVTYPLRIFLMIMKWLLDEEPKESKRGPAKRIWLNDPDDPGLRTRALSRIEADIKSLASELWEAAPERAEEWQEWETEIADPILAVIHRYLPDSAN